MAGPNGGNFPPVGVRRRPVAPPAGVARSSGGEVVTNGPPLKSGQLYSAPASGNNTLSEDTRRQLKLIGINEGDKIPQGLQARIAAAHKQALMAQETAKEEVAAVGRTRRIVPQQLTDLEELPPEIREQLKAEVAEMMANEQTAPPAQAVRLPGSDPGGVGEMTAWLQQQATAKPEVSLQEPEITKPLRQQAAPAEQPAEQPPATEAGTAEQSTLCPCCGFDQRVHFSAEPSPQDVQMFTAAILGGGRFYKEVPIMNGQMTLVFRSLTSAESRMAVKQVRYDINRGEVATPSDFLMQLADYRLALGLHEIRDANGERIFENPPLDTASERWPRKPDGSVDWVKARERQETPLLDRLEWFLHDGLTDESLRRVAGVHHQHFQRVVETMEARTADPNFWQGTAPQA